MKKNKVLAIIGGIVAVISLFSGVWLIDDRYVSASELKQVKKEIYLRLDTSEYQMLTEQYYKLKLLIKQHPEDEILREQFEQVCKDRARIKKSIDKALRE